MVVKFGATIRPHNQKLIKSSSDSQDKFYESNQPRVINITVFGECGIMPPSVQCIISTLCYLNRLYHLPGHFIVKQAYDELLRLHNNGFSTWIGNVCELVRTYNLDIWLTVNEFKNECKRVVCESFKNDWYRSLMNLTQNPSLRTYVSFKFSFKQEPYLHVTLQWRHNEHASVSNHQPNDYLLNGLFGRWSKVTSKLRVTGLCVGNSPGTGEFPAQKATNAENVSIWWRHHDQSTKISDCIVPITRQLAHIRNRARAAWSPQKAGRC